MQLPRGCALCEAALCPHIAMAANRFYVQTRFGLKNSGCVSCFKCFHCCVSVPVSCGRHCCEISMETENLLKSAVCELPASHCMNSVEIREYEFGNKEYAGPSAGVVGELPRHFSKIGVKAAANQPVQMKPL